MSRSKATPSSSSALSSSSASSWKDDINKLYQKMVTRKDSEFFREPVDWKGLELLDYPDIIKSPMDLLTLKRNLDKGVYSNPRDLAKDMRLIFTNAMTYNMPGSKVYTHAKSLGDFFEAQWTAIVKSNEDLQDKPPSAEMLTAFVEKCHRISPAELGKVLRKLETLNPEILVKKPDTNEVDINTDLFTGEIFRDIDGFLDEIIMDLSVFKSKRPTNTN